MVGWFIGRGGYQKCRSGTQLCIGRIFAPYGLRDAANRVWHLMGTLDPGDEITILRSGQAIPQNNGGDTVELLNVAGEVVDSGSYTSAPEGSQVTIVRTP